MPYKTMRTTICGLALIVFAAAAFAANASKPEFEPGSTMAKIQQTGKLVAGVKFDVPLFGQKNPLTGKLQGYEIDIAKQLGRDLFGEDGHVKFIEAPGPVREQYVKQKKADIVISTYTITAERMKTVQFAGPTYESKQAVVVAKNNQDFGDHVDSYADLNGHSVCVVTNSIAYNLLKKKAPNADVMALTANPECAKAVEQGRVETFATDDALLIGFVNKNPDKLRFVDNLGGEEQPYGIGINLDATDL